MLLTLGKIHPGIDGINSHLTHITCSFTSTNKISSPLKLCSKLTGSPGRIIRMDMIDYTLTCEFIFRRLINFMCIIHTCPIDYNGTMN